MEIKLSIKQDDIEQAIKDYVASKGITTPVREINFQVARKGGFSLTAEVEVSESPAQPVAPSGPINRAPQAETQDIDPQAGYRELEEKAKAEKPKAKPAPKAEKAEPKVEAPEPVVEEKDEPPFTPDAKEPSANDDAAPEKAAEPKGKSLFG